MFSYRAENLHLEISARHRGPLPNCRAFMYIWCGFGLLTKRSYTSGENSDVMGSGSSRVRLSKMDLLAWQAAQMATRFSGSLPPKAGERLFVIHFVILPGGVAADKASLLFAG